MQSFGFWDVLQLAFLALFLSISGGRTISLLVRHRLNPIRLGARQKGMQGLAELALFANVNLWGAAVVVSAVAPGVFSRLWFLGALLLPVRVTRWLGLTLIVLAFVLLILGQIALGSAWRLGIDEQHPGQLVTDGIYAFTRNPIYLFFDLYFVGTFLINGALFFALSAAFTVLNLHFQVLSEERHLERLHGADYRAYCACTARYWRRLGASRIQPKTQNIDVG